MTKLPPYEIPEADADLWECGVRLEQDARSWETDEIVRVLEWFRSAYGRGSFVRVVDLAGLVGISARLTSGHIKRLGDRLEHNARGYRIRTAEEIDEFRQPEKERKAEYDRQRAADIAYRAESEREASAEERWKSALRVVVVTSEPPATSPGAISQCEGGECLQCARIVVCFSDHDPLPMMPAHEQQETIANAGEQAAIG